MPPSRSFLFAVQFTLVREGGYSNDPADPGGETNFGIAKRYHPDVDIKNLTVDGATQIYYTDYWQKIQGDQLPPDVAFVLFDYAVLPGIGSASKGLQNLLKVKADGVIGPATLAEVPNYKGHLAADLLDKRTMLLLTGANPKFAVGWARRLVAQGYLLGATNWGEFK